MKGITRKKLIALLSAVGLAGTTASAAAQAVNGSEPTGKTQATSTAKSHKSKQENQAATTESLGKGEQKKWAEDSTKNDAAVKSRKAGGEQQAHKDVVTEKVGPDHIAHKHVVGAKYEKSQTESHADAGSKDAKTKGGKQITPDYTRHKKGQAQAETNSLHEEADVKGGRALDAGSKDAAKMSKASKEKSASADLIHKKEHKTQAHTDALTVKQKTGVQSNLPQPQPDQKTKSETPK